MDELREKIAEVLVRHRYLYAKKTPDGISQEVCACGWSTNPKSAAWVDFALHQSGKVIAALGLTDAYGRATDGMVNQLEAMQKEENDG